MTALSITFCLAKWIYLLECVKIANSGAPDTYLSQCSALRKNDYVVIRDRPCMIVEISTSNTEQNGNAKVHLIATDVFTGKKFEHICKSTDKMNVPYVTRKEYQLTDIDRDYISLMDDDGNMRTDIKLPDSEIGTDIKRIYSDGEVFLVTVVKALGEEGIVYPILFVSK